MEYFVVALNKSPIEFATFEEAKDAARELCRATHYKVWVFQRISPEESKIVLTVM